MQDVIRTKIDYPKIAGILKEQLHLDGSPVAVKFIPGENLVPEDVPHIGETIPHCQMVNRARKEGAIFYATKENHSCMGGAYALGLREITPTLKNGEFYFKLGKYDSWASCKRTIDRIPHVESGATYATAYAPLEMTPFDPTIVLIVTTPKAMLKLAQSSLYLLGGRINCNLAGIQSVCADASAQVYLSGAVNFSLGCDGSRKYSGIQEHEMVMGIPAEMLSQIADALPIVTGAPGSS
ncbi:MAG: DUF169 domain-containing protein [Methanospirillum sp.]|nr:DUF169 domain-containing protein [Methanospirillum sp.]